MSNNPFRGNGLPPPGSSRPPGATSSRPLLQQQQQQQSQMPPPPRSQQPGGSNSSQHQIPIAASTRGHTRQSSSTSALSPAALRAAGGAPIPLSNEQVISHRHSPSLNGGVWTPDRQQQQHHQFPQQFNSNNQGNNGHVHPGLYQNASIPSSPDLQLNGGHHNGFFGGGSNQRGGYSSSSPAGPSSSPYQQGGRGIKHAGVGIMGFGGRHKEMDDNASIASLIDRDDDSASYLGHSNGGMYRYGSDGGHSGSQHDDGFLMPGVPNRVTNYPSISNKHIPTQQHQLRTKTSYKDFKNSEHKMLSNEEKYNAYVMPGMQQYEGPEPDDALHDPGPRLKGKGPDRRLADNRNIHGTTAVFSWRGWLNVIGLLCVILPLVGFFAAYPIVSYVLEVTNQGSSSVYVNGTGQVPDLPNFPGLIDRDTPESVLTKIGQDGHEYTLVFSDEFNTDGRTFYEGDDPYWNAVDMHYYSTDDVEYYDPSRITTQNGYLTINLTHVDDPSTNHNFSYMSGMLTSWNQLCFTGGIVEASVSLPGTPDITGLWPAFWTMGNLGRASYGSTLEGMWPYSYDSCDTGTLPNQTDFTKSATAVTTTDGAPLSYLPGQKLSACTCSGEDHPGPSNNVGRSAPELDVFEALVNTGSFYGEISQTLQMAPFDMDYTWPNASGTYTVGHAWDTELNEYKGGIFQQSISALSRTDQESYYLQNRRSFQTYSYEYMPSTGKNTDGYAYWRQNDTTNFYLEETGLAGDPALDTSQRLIPREPMYMIMNLGMAENFNPINYDDLTFPAIMRFDWVRIYQRSDHINIGCDPKDFPTADYIQRHINAYTDWNMTVWVEEEPDGFPKNSLLDGC